MGRVFRATCRVAGRKWTFETGGLATLAHGACLVSVNSTVVLGTAVYDPTPLPDADGVPLQVPLLAR
jgi:polyribonucleotide nucleotidyltransferase